MLIFVRGLEVSFAWFYFSSQIYYDLTARNPIKSSKIHTLEFPLCLATGDYTVPALYTWWLCLVLVVH